MSQQVVGEAVVLIRAQDTGLEADIKGKVQRALSNVKAEAKVTADTQQAEQSIKAVGDKAGTIKAEAKVTADTSQAEGALGRLGGLVEGAIAKLQQFGVPTGALGSVASLLDRIRQAGGGAAEGLSETASGAEEADAALLDTTSSAATTAGTFDKLITRAKVLGGIALAGLAVNAGRSFMALTDQVDTLADKMGSTAEDASDLRNIIAELGVDTDQMANIMFGLSQRVITSAEAFDRHGVTIARNKDGTVDLLGTLYNISDAYNEAEGAAAKNSVVTDLLSTRGRELVDVLEQGGDALRRMAKSGPSISQGDIDKANRFRQQLRDLKDEALSTGHTLAGPVVGALTVAVDWLGKGAGAVEKVFGAVAGWGDAAGKAVGGFFQRLVGANDEGTESNKKAAAAARDHGIQQLDLGRNVKKTADEIREEREQLDRLIQSQEDALGTTQSLSGAHNDTWGAAIAVTDAEEDLAEALDEHGRGSREAEKAEHSLESARQRHIRSIVDLATKQRDQEVQMRELGGETISQAEKTAILNRRMDELSQTVSGPVRREVNLLKGDLDRIPEVKNIDVTANTVQAEDALRELIFLLGLTQQEANIAVQLFGVDQAYATLAALRADAHSNYLATIPPDAFGQSGGTMFPGRSFIVGEKRAERVRMLAGGVAVIEQLPADNPWRHQRARSGGDVTQMVSIEVHNPAPEPASTSLPRAMRMAAATLAVS